MRGIIDTLGTAMEYALKLMLRALVPGAFLILAATVARAEHIVPDQQITAAAFCADEASAKGLSAALAQDGSKGYKAYMNLTDNRCFDTEFHYMLGIQPLRLVAKSVAWKVVDPTGLEYSFWIVVDTAGTPGYAWSLEPKPKQPATQET